MSLENRVAVLEAEVKALKEIVTKLTGVQVQPAPPKLPKAHTKEWEQNQKEANFSVKAAVTGHIKNESYTKYYSVDKARKLGSGMNGTVYAVTDSTGSHFAIKSVSKKRMSRSQIKGIRKEIGLLAQLDHPNIVKLVEAFEEPDNITMILEICSGGELYDNLVEQEFYTEAVARRVFRQMVTAVGYVHQMGIAHRDLKLENFLFESKDKDSAIKLIDFGLSKKYGISKMQSMVGTAYYIAPEVLHGKEYGPKCDVWSLGIILFMMLSGWPPFGGDSDKEIMQQVKHFKGNVFATPETTDGSCYWDAYPAAKALLAKLLEKDWRKRLSCEEILKDPWLQDSHKAKIDHGVLKQLQKSLNTSKLRQATAQVIALSLPTEKIREIQKSFSVLDTDSSGHISLEEFKRGMESGGMAPKDAEAIFKKVDSDQTGFISYSEFLSAALSSSEYMTKDRILQCFDRLDKDRSGTLERSELAVVLKGLMNESEVAAVLKAADTDGDGAVSRDEFVNAVMNL